MNILLKKELKSGYTSKILIDEEGRLAVQLVNSKDEFVGQLFVSEETVKDTFSRVANYTESLEESEINKIEESLKTAKTESLKFLSRQLKNL